MNDFLEIMYGILIGVIIVYCVAYFVMTMEEIDEIRGEEMRQERIEQQCAD